MTISRELETIFFSFGFSRCLKNDSINFLKLTKDEYLVFRIFRDKVIKLGFNRDEDLSILKKMISQKE